MAIREAAVSGATRSYRYPVLTLPNEIVGEIFAHVLPIHRAPSVQTPPLRGSDSPTLLAQICRQWRDLALENPALWRALSLNDASIPSEHQAHLCTLWLSMSRCPLSLDIDEDLDALGPLWATELLSALVPHRARWEHLNLYLSLSRLDTIEGPMPLLQSLDLYTWGPPKSRFCRRHCYT
ncbi:hypothetical protein DFH08DRAFT_459149 [Mycena albidolilacea]|uniref:F-box domain-containing protein n=1 Tax=Mycena albidolilacea TaxID=1033008 RepID=A0AAD7AE01_9AGAR|nr:hypothetical protein DFH08DRAFT_459149 [Mycena albidolilacea]